MTPAITKLMAERRAHLEAAAEIEKLPIMKTARETHLRMAKQCGERIRALCEVERLAEKRVVK